MNDTAKTMEEHCIRIRHLKPDDRVGIILRRNEKSFLVWCGLANSNQMSIPVPCDTEYIVRVRNTEILPFETITRPHTDVDGIYVVRREDKLYVNPS